MKNKTLTPRQILNDTVAYYSEDTSRRAVDDDSNCKYWMKNPNDKRKVKMCAIGRVLKKGVAKSLAYSCIAAEVLLIDGHIDFVEFKPKYRYKNIDFWTMLQNLHDTQDYWDDYGLTRKGKNFMLKIRAIEWN